MNKFLSKIFDICRVDYQLETLTLYESYYLECKYLLSRYILDYIHTVSFADSSGFPIGSLSSCQTGDRVTG